MEEIYATADFKVTGTSEVTGKEIDTTVHFELYKSGAFDYGNGTGMSMQFKGSMEQCYDTRYEPVTVDNFKEYAEDFLKGYLAKGLKAEAIQ
jgi:hypothetical protein